VTVSHVPQIQPDPIYLTFSYLLNWEAANTCDEVPETSRTHFLHPITTYYNTVLGHITCWAPCRGWCSGCQQGIFQDIPLIWPRDWVMEGKTHQPLPSCSASFSMWATFQWHWHYVVKSYCKNNYKSNWCASRMCIEKRKASPKADCPAERGEIAWTPQTSGVRAECPAAGDPLHKYVGTSASYSLVTACCWILLGCFLHAASHWLPDKHSQTIFLTYATLLTPSYTNVSWLPLSHIHSSCLTCWWPRTFHTFHAEHPTSSRLLVIRNSRCHLTLSSAVL
jgi:hypothetical protein